MKILLNGREIKRCYTSEIIYRVTSEVGFNFKEINILRQIKDDSQSDVEWINFKADGAMCSIGYKEEDTDTEFICGKFIFKSSYISWSFSGYRIGMNNDSLTGLSCIKNPNFDTVVKCLKDIENFKKKNSEFEVPKGFGAPAGAPQNGFKTNITEGKR